MAASSASLPWLEKTRYQIENLQEWKEFTTRLNDAVQQQMNERNVNFFTDLSETEKVFVLEKAARALHTGDVYNKLAGQIRSCLEDNIYSYVSDERQSSDITKNQSDQVTGHIQDGVINILDKRPGMKGKLHALFNQPLPGSLRTLTWRLQLSNTKARMEYLTQVSMNKARSVLDREISLHCQALLSKEQTFQHLKDNQISVRTMRNVLSYYHTLQHIQGSLPEAAYLLLVPLVHVVIDTCTPSTLLDSVSTLLVEEYITFMDSRPTLMRKLYSSEDSTSNEKIFQEMALVLNKIDQNLVRTVQSIYASLATNPEEALLLGMHKILQPILQTLFVGYLNMSTLLYVWDQYIIGLDQPAYNCLPAISLAFLILLQDHLRGCLSHSEVETVIKTKGPTLSVQEFQVIISKYFYTELFSVLNKDGSSHFPVHDPTQAARQSSHLSKASAPPRTRPQDRRQAREEREMLKKQTAERREKEEKMQRLIEEEQKRQEVARLNRLLEDTKRRFEAQKARLENQLMQEQQRSYEVQKRSEEQISELQGEIKQLMEQRRMSVGEYSVESLIAPPPSVNSETPPQTWHSNPPTPGPKTVSNHTADVKEVNGKTARTVLQDLLKQMMESADLIINGESVAERDTLNAIMREHLKTYKEDVKNAEIEIFGHELGLNELESMDEPNRTAIAQRLSLAIRRGAEARYTAVMNAGKQKFTETVTYTNKI